MNEYGERAKAMFYQGYNCSQSVVAACAPLIGLEEDLALRLSCGFGGGIGRLREVCGAFCGLTAVISLYYTDPANPQDKSRVYAMVQELAARYKQENGGGSLICRQLLGLEKPEGSPVAEARTAEYYKKRPCPELAALAASMAADYIAAHPARDWSPLAP